MQKLLLRSYANLLESVRRITQDNSGKNTPGVDKEVIKTPESRVKLVNIETHHIVLVKNGGSDDAENLIHLHAPCHKQEHSKTKFKAGSMA
ncbi:MAG: reverse transcriptase N-terminal domain-containing protein [Cyanobacteria bacterium P01_A01_bin.83]